MDYIMAFVIGGIICATGQILMDATKLSPAHVLVLFVTLGTVLSGLGIYKPIVEIGKAGATIPLTGFGHTLVTGVIEDIDKRGFLGIFTGGLTSAAAGITAAVVFGYLMSLIFNPKSK